MLNSLCVECLYRSEDIDLLRLKAVVHWSHRANFLSYRFLLVGCISSGILACPILLNQPPTTVELPQPPHNPPQQGGWIIVGCIIFCQRKPKCMQNLHFSMRIHFKALGNMLFDRVKFVPLYTLCMFAPIIFIHLSCFYALHLSESL